MDKKFKQFDEEELAKSFAMLGKEFSLGKNEKENLRNRLFRKVDFVGGGVDLIRGDLEVELRRGLEKNDLNAYRRFLLKELIFEKIEMGLVKRSWHWEEILKRVVAGGLAVLMVGFYLLPGNYLVVRAGKYNVVEEVGGKVEVMRGGKILVPERNFQIQEGDKIVGTVGSFVSIRFVDDSVAKIYDDSEVELGKILDRSLVDSAVKVELSLGYGKIWSKVSNVRPRGSSFEIKTNNAVAKGSDNSSFALMAEKSRTQVKVFENVVDLKPKQDLESLSYGETILEGFEGVINSGLVVTSAGLVTEHSFVVRKGQDLMVWESENIKNDENLEKELIGRKTKMLIKDGSEQGIYENLARFKQKTSNLFVDENSFESNWLKKQCQNQLENR